jgi:hypothetical protein
MTILRKIFFRILFLLLLCVVLLVIVRNTVGSWVGAPLLQNTLNFRSSIAFVDIQITTPRIEAREVSLLNSRDFFEEPIAGKLSRIEIDYDPLTLIQKSPHLKRVEGEFENITIIRNSKGRINWSVLNELSQMKDSDRLVRIDELVLTVNHLTYIDESLSPHKTLKFNPVRKVATYVNIRSTDELRNAIDAFISESLPKTWEVGTEKSTTNRTLQIK